MAKLLDQALEDAAVEMMDPPSRGFSGNLRTALEALVVEERFRRGGPAPVTGGLHPLALTQGRTLAHFHSFYNNGRELPTLARRETEPTLWISPADAATRNIADGAAIRVHNDGGDLLARARVTDRIGPGAVWMRDGWPELNRLTDGAPVLPDAAVDLFAFAAGQATFDAMVEVAPA